MIKLCLIGDCLLTRNAYVKAISTSADIEFIGDFEKITECVKFLERQQADGILIDIQMNAAGLDLIRQLKSKFAKIRIIVMTDYLEKDYLFNALSLGANAFVLKNMSLEKFVRVIYSATEGNLFISSGAVDPVTNLFQSEISKSKQLEELNLTNREIEILTLVAEGKSNAEIGNELALSPLTIKNYISRILEKLEVKDRTQATAKAIQCGLVS